MRRDLRLFTAGSCRPVPRWTGPVAVTTRRAKSIPRFGTAPSERPTHSVSRAPVPNLVSGDRVPAPMGRSYQALHRRAVGPAGQLAAANVQSTRGRDMRAYFLSPG